MTADESGMTPVSAIPEPSDVEGEGEAVEGVGDTAAIRAVGYHRGLLWCSAAILVAAIVLNTSGGGHVKIPFLGITTPGLCFWRLSTGFDCPGCGLTRCFVAMAHADWAAAWHYHPAGMALFVLVVAQLPYRGIQLRRLARGRSELKHPALPVIPWILLVVFLVQWLLKITGLVQF